MSDVTLSIGGRRYKLACAPGEEEHIAALGQAVDAKLAALPRAARQSEVQTLLYVALLLADELHDRTAAKSGEPAIDPMDELAGPLERLASRLETIASDLEDTSTSA